MLLDVEVEVEVEVNWYGYLDCSLFERQMTISFDDKKIRYDFDDKNTRYDCDDYIWRQEYSIWLWQLYLTTRRLYCYINLGHLIIHFPGDIKSLLIRRP
jgi:hypothetical protein